MSLARRFNAGEESPLVISSRSDDWIQTSLRDTCISAQQ